MEDYESLEKLLNSVSKANDENALSIFKDIAENLFKHYVIRKGNEKFRFLEVEFYYHSYSHPDDFVYNRRCDKEGDFLIHSSGVDICFKNEEQNNTYGGILLRHLLRIEGINKSVVAGPWDCCDAIFNYTDQANYPYLWREDRDFNEQNLGNTYRFNAKGNMAERPYCFYDKSYIIDECNEWGEKGIPFLRYNPTLKETGKNRYSSKPWNRQ